VTEIVRSLALFSLAALAEIGGAWLVWQGLRENRGWLWVGMVMDGFRPDRKDIIGALVCLVGVAVIMYAPRTS
jgi:small multidrug resistance family-3 protein